jgi:hypothetical protein
VRLIKVPWLPSPIWAITLAPFVLILKSQSDNKALIAHEQKHLDQIREYGRARWYWRYITDLDFRRRQEAEGYAVQKRYGGGMA